MHDLARRWAGAGCSAGSTTGCSRARSASSSATTVRAAGVEVLHEPLDRAALAGGVAALEHHDDALAGVLDPGLHLEQLDLQQPLGHLVLAAGHPLVVRVALPPGVDGRAVRADEDRVVDLVPGAVAVRPRLLEAPRRAAPAGRDDVGEVHHGLDVELAGIAMGVHGPIMACTGWTSHQQEHARARVVPGGVGPFARPSRVRHRFATRVPGRGGRCSAGAVRERTGAGRARVRTSRGCHGGADGRRAGLRESGRSRGCCAVPTGARPVRTVWRPHVNGGGAPVEGGAAGVGGAILALVSPALQRWLALRTYLSEDAFGGPKVLKLSWVINAQKGGTLPFVLALMALTDTWTATAWTYLALHGSYGLIWLLKDRVMPDRGGRSGSPSAGRFCRSCSSSAPTGSPRSCWCATTRNSLRGCWPPPRSPTPWAWS